MVKKVVVGNISAAAGANIDLTGKIPAPIYSIASATLLAGYSDIRHPRRFICQSH